jgi:hypothetical protein
MARATARLDKPQQPFKNLDYLNRGASLIRQRWVPLFSRHLFARPHPVVDAAHCR